VCLQGCLEICKGDRWRPGNHDVWKSWSLSGDRAASAPCSRDCSHLTADDRAPSPETSPQPFACRMVLGRSAIAGRVLVIEQSFQFRLQAIAQFAQLSVAGCQVEAALTARTANAIAPSPQLVRLRDGCKRLHPRNREAFDGDRAVAGRSGSAMFGPREMTCSRQGWLQTPALPSRTRAGVTGSLANRMQL